MDWKLYQGSGYFQTDLYSDGEAEKQDDKAGRKNFFEGKGRDTDVEQE